VRIKGLLILVLFFLAFGLFLARGPVRGLYRGGGGDFATPYIAAIRLSKGHDPYACCGTFEQEWTASGAPRNDPMDMSGQHPIYPPTTLVLMLPFASFRWRTALSLYIAATSCATVLLILCFAHFVGRDWYSHRRLVMVSFSLALAPIHTGIAVGNLSAPAFVLSGFAVLLAYRRYDILAGITLAMGLCIKPSMAAALFLYFIFTARWRLIFSSAAGCVGVLIATWIKFHSINPVWLEHYRRNVAFLFGPLGSASYQPLYADSINLQNPLFAIFQSTLFAESIAWGIALMLCAFWIRSQHIAWKAGGKWSWASVGSLWLIGLLPIYQRSYNAGILVLALVWAFRNLDRRAARVAICLASVFLIPGYTILYELANSKGAHSFEQTEIFKALVLCHATWALVGIICTLLVYVGKSDLPPVEVSLTNMHDQSQPSTA
jgi:hypothetical protein